RAVSAVSINDRPTKNSALDHSMLMTGGKIVFSYSDINDKTNTYGVSEHPSSSINESPIIPSPIIKSQSQVFEETMEINLESINGGSGSLVYTLDGKEPTRKSSHYIKPFVIDSNRVVKAKFYSGTDS